jgi:hypothetical protein
MEFIVVLNTLWAVAYRYRVRALRRLLDYLCVLFMQFVIILLGVFCVKTGRLEPIISADAISITTIEQVFYNVIVPAIKLIAFTLVIATGIGVALASRHKGTATYAKQCFFSCKQNWPWCDPTGLPERSGDLHLYTYKDVSKGQIRLLKVFRPGPEKRFECELVHMSLEDRPFKYLAVSYRWGGPAEPKAFFENNQYLNISTSVEIILDTVLEAGECIHLWIDSICINQSNVAEQSAQVQLMREIYVNAEQVIICLGEATPDTDEAMEFIVTLRDAFEKIPQKRYGSSLASGMGAVDLAMLGIDLSKARWTALSKLLCRPWWNRVWVIQEAAVGSNPIFICGDRAVEWDVMAYVIQETLLHGPLARMLAITVDESESSQSQPVNAAMHLIQMSAARVQAQSKKFSPFQNILMDMVGYEALDPHDRVYGLLGLSSDRGDPELSPNYDLDGGDAKRIPNCNLAPRDGGDAKRIINYKSARKAFIKTARHLLTHKKSILILHRAGIENARYPKDAGLNEGDLPSWVPGWSSRLASEDSLCIGRGWAEYNASGSLSPSVSSSGDDQETLDLRGILVDCIDKVSTLKEEKKQELQESKNLHTAPQPAGKAASSRIFDLEDERKIAIKWVSDHQRLMKESRLSHKAGTALALPNAPSHWKSEYERTITAAALGETFSPAFNAEFEAIWDRALDHASDSKKSRSMRRSYDTTVIEQSTLFHRRFMTATTNRRFFTTREKRIGIGSRMTEAGDIVVIFLGGSTPFVIRETGSGGKEGPKEYRLVGEAYVDGLMAGEGVKGLEQRIGAVVNIRLC